MRFVFPGQEALEVLERAGTTKDECTTRLEQMLASELVQLSVFGTRVSPETIELSDDPRQQGGFSFTYYISIRDNSEERRFVAQFREDSIERTSLDILNAAETVFGSFVAKPLFISMENKLQLTIWEYYGENLQYKFIYDKLTHEQKKTAIRQYATFLALGCRDGLTDTPSNSKVYETFQRLATWSFPPSVANIILALNASLGFLISLDRTNK
jgi:hypothetical protein